VSATKDVYISASQFGALAAQFCSVVDTAFERSRTDLLVNVYRLLPRLISEAIQLPEIILPDDDGGSTGSERAHSVRMCDREWEELYERLKKHLGDWDPYWQVFDPTTDRSADAGSLADDLADIYRDLKEGLIHQQVGTRRAEEIVWDWRLLFYSHWGKHAMDALLTLHFRLQGSGMTLLSE